MSKVTLEDATEKQIFAELERRFGTYLFVGEHLINGKVGLKRWTCGNMLSVFGMLHASEARLRLGFLRGATPSVITPTTEIDVQASTQSEGE